MNIFKKYFPAALSTFIFVSILDYLNAPTEYKIGGFLLVGSMSFLLTAIMKPVNMEEADT